MDFFNKYQYDDLLQRQNDPYANAKYRIILEHFKREKSLRILNAGCGSGELSFLLAHAGYTVVGIDPAPEYIKLAMRVAHTEGLERCTFHVSTIEEFDGGDLYDAVVATDVLEHIEDDKAATEKLVQMLKPGGLLVITVPALQFLFGFHDKEIGHFRRYSRCSLRKLICRAGVWSALSIRYFGWTLIPVCLLWSKVLRRPYPMAATWKKGIASAVLRLLLAFDALLPFPFGTSLILFGKKA